MNEVNEEYMVKAMRREVELTEANALYMSVLILAARRLHQAQVEIREALNIYESDGTKMVSNPLTQQFFEKNQDLLTVIEAVFPNEWDPLSSFGAAAQMKALGDILAERKAQDVQFGYVTHNGPKWLSILMEEVGEMCQDINQGNDYQEELVQVAAVAMSWLEAIECKATQCPGEPS